MKTILFLVFVLFTWDVAAQSTPSVFNYKTAVSFNPSVLAGPDYTAMFGAEYRLKERFALTLDVGYVFDSYYFREGSVKGTSGFSIRPGVKLYPRPDKQFYFQFSIFYKHVDYKMYDWLGKDCVNQIPTYEQLQDFRYRKKTLSFNVLRGRNFRISDQVFVELYAGLGIKIKDQGPTEKHACHGNLQTGIINRSFQGNQVTAHVPLGIKLVVAVN
jgi:hypothetical protein